MMYTLQSTNVHHEVWCSRMTTWATITAIDHTVSLPVAHRSLVARRHRRVFALCGNSSFTPSGRLAPWDRCSCKVFDLGSRVNMAAAGPGVITGTGSYRPFTHAAQHTAAVTPASCLRIDRSPHSLPTDCSFIHELFVSAVSFDSFQGQLGLKCVLELFWLRLNTTMYCGKNGIFSKTSTSWCSAVSRC